MTIRLGILCLVALACSSVQHPAVGQIPSVALSLNLRYNDPADPSEGGRWFLIAKTTPDASNLGLGALSAYITNINTGGIVFGNDGVAGFKYPAVTGSTLGAEVSTPDGGPFVGNVGSVVHIVYGQDNSVGAPTPLVLGIGTGAGTPGSVPLDPLRGTSRFGGTVNTTWDNAALIASGTFPSGSGNLPKFAAPEVNVTTASVLTSAALGSPLAEASVSTTRRGDSIAQLQLNTPPNSGLPRGDTDRDFDIDGDDLNTLLVNFNTTGKSWDTADVTDGLSAHVEGRVNSDDLSSILISFNSSRSAPMLVAVPEPATASLFAIGLLGGTMIRRRSWSVLPC